MTSNIYAFERLFRYVHTLSKVSSVVGVCISQQE